MKNKGHKFSGLSGGKYYKFFASLSGYGEKYYSRCIGNLSLESGEKALDLGCGPGGLCFALGNQSSEDAEITGIDISADQLKYATEESNSYKCPMNFIETSMDEIPFPDDYFNIVMTSMALHAAPPEVRRGAIRETVRVLKKGGVFLLCDWSRPRPGIQALLWLPHLIWGEKNRDNWHNLYKDICELHGLTLKEDSYLNSLARRQVFIKK
ncbi:class I SAM-dependent methyltransferase [Myxococcota bacterium]|nr:class I SAM-dependent methyltransferase [Myxococcota bacterium]MBU1381405.1 class I SAM-dependent methyltransferase [Myxococcota bacterium]MBU1496263.1 class I SAM-dependent methyltransferase [Myxococcota bacterium]